MRGTLWYSLIACAVYSTSALGIESACPLPSVICGICKEKPIVYGASLLIGMVSFAITYPLVQKLWPIGKESDFFIPTVAIASVISAVPLYGISHALIDYGLSQQWHAKCKKCHKSSADKCRFWSYPCSKMAQTWDYVRKKMR